MTQWSISTEILLEKFIFDKKLSQGHKKMTTFYSKSNYKPTLQIKTSLLFCISIIPTRAQFLCLFSYKNLKNPSSTQNKSPRKSMWLMRKIGKFTMLYDSTRISFLQIWIKTNLNIFFLNLWSYCNNAIYELKQKVDVCDLLVTTRHTCRYFNRTTSI